MKKKTTTMKNENDYFFPSECFTWNIEKTKANKKRFIEYTNKKEKWIEENYSNYSKMNIRERIKIYDHYESIFGEFRI